MSERLKELRAARDSLIRDINNYQSETKDTTEESVTKFEAMVGKLEQAEKDISSFERHQALQAKFVGIREEAERSKRPVTEQELEADAPFEDISKTSYRYLFARHIQDVCNVEKFTTEEAEAWAQFTVNRATRAAGGNVVVPTNLADSVFVAAQDMTPMLNPAVVTLVRTSDSAHMLYPTISDVATTKARTGAGVTAENAASSENVDPVINGANLNSYRVSGTPVRVSKSFLRATPAAVEQAMITVLSRRLAFEAGSLATTGTGASNGQPHGIVPRSSAGTTSSSNNAVVADEWTQLPYKLDSVNWGSWMLNQKIMGLLASLRDTGGQFLFRLDTDATGRGILNNLPYNFNPAMAESVAANAVIGLFGNMRAYATRVVDLQEIQILRELYAAQGDIGFAMEFEVGGDILDAEAIKKLQAAA